MEDDDETEKPGHAFLVLNPLFRIRFQESNSDMSRLSFAKVCSLFLVKVPSKTICCLFVLILPLDGLLSYDTVGCIVCSKCFFFILNAKHDERLCAVVTH